MERLNLRKQRSLESKTPGPKRAVELKYAPEPFNEVNKIIQLITIIGEKQISYCLSQDNSNTKMVSLCGTRSGNCKSI